MKNDYQQYCVTDGRGTYGFFQDFGEAVNDYRKMKKNTSQKQTGRVYGLVDLTDSLNNRYPIKGDELNCHKFRGFCRETQEWKYGFLHLTKSGLKIDDALVIESSVGRCCDIEDLPILFEGDIVGGVCLNEKDELTLFRGEVVLDRNVDVGWKILIDETWIPMSRIRRLQVLENTAEIKLSISRRRKNRLNHKINQDFYDKVKACQPEPTLATFQQFNDLIKRSLDLIDAIDKRNIPLKTYSIDWLIRGVSLKMAFMNRELEIILYPGNLDDCSLKFEDQINIGETKFSLYKLDNLLHWLGA